VPLLKPSEESAETNVKSRGRLKVFPHVLQAYVSELLSKGSRLFLAWREFDSNGIAGGVVLMELRLGMILPVAQAKLCPAFRRGWGVIGVVENVGAMLSLVD